jgi:hypothetical protein
VLLTLLASDCEADSTTSCVNAAAAGLRICTVLVKGVSITTQFALFTSRKVHILTHETALTPRRQLNSRKVRRLTAQTEW